MLTVIIAAIIAFDSPVPSPIPTSNPSTVALCKQIVQDDQADPNDSMTAQTFDAEMNQLRTLPTFPGTQNPAASLIPTRYAVLGECLYRHLDYADAADAYDSMQGDPIFGSYGDKSGLLLVSSAHGPSQYGTPQMVGEDELYWHIA